MKSLLLNIFGLNTVGEGNKKTPATFAFHVTESKDLTYTKLMHYTAVFWISIAKNICLLYGICLVHYKTMKQVQVKLLYRERLIIPMSQQTLTQPNVT
jgi:hypothetical protein